tara:strand:+ start:1980 stop:2144 length:165 start_codon:yes stop_codon:yes gene_type:complete
MAGAVVLSVEHDPTMVMRTARENSLFIADIEILPKIRECSRVDETLYMTGDKYL